MINLEKQIIDKFNIEIQAFYKKNLAEINQNLKFENFKEINKLNENFLMMYVKEQYQLKNLQLTNQELDYLIKNSDLNLINNLEYSTLSKSINYYKSLNFDETQWNYLIENSNMEKLNKGNAKHHPLSMSLFFMGKDGINKNYIEKIIRKMNLKNQELNKIINYYQSWGAFKAIQEILRPIIDKMLIERKLIKGSEIKTNKI